MTYTTTAHCGNDHLKWLESMEFYKEDLDTLEKRLLEIVKKNNGNEAMAGIEHFQNQFIIQRNNIEELKHGIHEHSGKVASDTKAHAGKMGVVRVSDHEAIGEQVEIFEKVINDLRHEFNQFLAKWM